MKENIFTKRTILLLLTGVGLVLFWRGIWEASAKFFSEDIGLIAGLAILVVATYQRRQLFQFFGGGK